MGKLRVVLHVHSDWSYDGSWTLAAISRLFGRLGADAVMMSEHDDTFDAARFAAYRSACAEASAHGARLIPGIEYSSPDNSVHILSWGLDGFHGPRRPVLDILRAIADSGGVAVLAHPRRREAWHQVREDWIPLLAATEVWNRKTDGFAPSREAMEIMERWGLPAVAGMDFHRARHLYPLYNYLDANAGPVLAEADLVDALRRRRLAPVAFGWPILSGEGPRLTRPAATLARLEDLRRPVARLRHLGRARGCSDHDTTRVQPAERNLG